MSENPLYAKQSGKAGRVSETTGKVFDKKIGNTKIPKDVKMRPDFYSNKVDRRLQILAFFSKFTQNEELKHMLLSTGDAELWHYVGRGGPNQLWKHLMNVRRCIRKYDAEYDLQEISKFNTNDVTEMLQ